MERVAEGFFLAGIPEKVTGLLYALSVLTDGNARAEHEYNSNG